MIDLGDAALLLALVVQRSPAWHVLPEALLAPPPMEAVAAPGIPADAAGRAVPRARLGILGLVGKLAGTVAKAAKTANVGWPAASAATYGVLVEVRDRAARAALRARVRPRPRDAQDRHERARHVLHPVPRRDGGHRRRVHLAAAAGVRGARGAAVGLAVRARPGGPVALDARPAVRRRRVVVGGHQPLQPPADRAARRRPRHAGVRLLVRRASASRSRSSASAPRSRSVRRSGTSSSGSSRSSAGSSCSPRPRRARAVARCGLPERARFGPDHFRWLRAVAGPPLGSPSEPLFARACSAWSRRRRPPRSGRSRWAWGLGYAALAGGLLALVHFMSHVPGANIAAQILS